MRKLLKTIGAGALLALLVAWPVMGAGPYDVTIAEGGVVAGCFTDESGDEIVAGTVTVESGTGTFWLNLMGQAGDGEGYNFLGDAVPNPDTIVSTGAGTYAFEFNTTNVPSEIKSFRVDAVDGPTTTVNPAKSLSFPRDCDTPIDEAPFAILLLITGGLAAVWFASRQMKSTARPTAA